MKSQLTILFCLSFAAFMTFPRIPTLAAAMLSNPVLDGDFDLDGDRDGDDIDILTQYADLTIGFEPNAFEYLFDLDGNNWVDLYDIVEWLRLGTIPSNGTGSGPTIMGDADLDGDVDREDLGILLDSIANAPHGIPGKYTSGDFNGSNDYDGEDLIIWGRGFRFED